MLNNHYKSPSSVIILRLPLIGYSNQNITQSSNQKYCYRSSSNQGLYVEHLYVQLDCQQINLPICTLSIHPSRQSSPNSCIHVYNLYLFRSTFNLSLTLWKLRDDWLLTIIPDLSKPIKIVVRWCWFYHCHRRLAVIGYSDVCYVTWTNQIFYKNQNQKSNASCRYYSEVNTIKDTDIVIK